MRVIDGKKENYRKGGTQMRVIDGKKENYRKGGMKRRRAVPVV
jgi:hypothetical protein